MNCEIWKTLKLWNHFSQYLVSLPISKPQRPHGYSLTNVQIFGSDPEIGKSYSIYHQTNSWGVFTLHCLWIIAQNNIQKYILYNPELLSWSRNTWYTYSNRLLTQDTRLRQVPLSSMTSRLWLVRLLLRCPPGSPPSDSPFKVKPNSALTPSLTP